jgi:hypothetical protein
VVDLKAELLKKQQESSTASSSTASQSDSYIATPLTLSGTHKLPRPSSSSKSILNSKQQNKGLEKRLERDLGHESSELEASWVALQRKARIYEKLEEEGTLDAETNEGFDFEYWGVEE